MFQKEKLIDNMLQGSVPFGQRFKKRKKDGGFPTHKLAIDKPVFAISKCLGDHLRVISTLLLQAHMASCSFNRLLFSPIYS